MKSPTEIAEDIVDTVQSQYVGGGELLSRRKAVAYTLRVIKAERDRAKVLEDALEFYASGQHMDADDYDTEIMDQLDFDLYEYWHGRYARQALAKYRSGE